jgi:hypothetical protein
MALVHPSLWQPEDADNMTVPVALLPSQGEDIDVMNKFWDRIQKKPFANKCVRRDFVRCIPLFAVHQSPLKGRFSSTFTTASHRRGRTGLIRSSLVEQGKLMRLWFNFSKITSKDPEAWYIRAFALFGFA